VSKAALGMLQNLKVDVKLQTKVTRSTRTARDGADQVELNLSDGTKLTTDIYIPTFGILPNSWYIPGKYLDANGFVKVDE
jgi:NADPH-dependent 2,4-dienoyl-CoA reductase/sulfur reductase-like enzyme